jgi:hypothetical protein
MKIFGTGLIQQIPYNYDLLNKLASEKNQSLRNLKINLEVIEYFLIFVMSLKHHDRSQRKMEGQSKVIRLFFI